MSSSPDWAAVRYVTRGPAALARQSADIERADAARRGVQNIEAVPALLDGAERLRGLVGFGEHGRAIGARQSALPQDEDDLLAFHALMHSRAGRQAVGPGAQIGVVVSEVGFLADDADEDIALAASACGCGH